MPKLQNTQRYTINVYKVTSFDRASFSYLAVQPPFYLNFLWTLGYARRLAFGSPWGVYFTPGLCEDNLRCRGISNLRWQHRPVRVPIHTLVEWSLYIYPVLLYNSSGKLYTYKCITFVISVPNLIKCIHHF